MASWKDHGPGGCCCGCFTVGDDFCDGDYNIGDMTWTKDNSTNWTNGVCESCSQTPYGITSQTPELYIRPVLSGGVPGATNNTAAFVFGTTTFNVYLSVGAALLYSPGPILFSRATNDMFLLSWYATDGIPPLYGTYPVTTRVPIPADGDYDFTVKIEKESSVASGSQVTSVNRVYVKRIGADNSTYTECLCYGGTRLADAFGNSATASAGVQLPVTNSYYEQNSGSPGAVASTGKVCVKNYSWTASASYGLASCPTLTKDWLTNFRCPNNTDPSQLRIEFTGMPKTGHNLTHTVGWLGVRYNYQNANQNYSNNQVFTSGGDDYHLIWRQTLVEIDRAQLRLIVTFAHVLAIAIPTPTDGTRVTFTFAYPTAVVPNNIFPITISLADCVFVRATTTGSVTIAQDMYDAVFDSGSRFTVTPICGA